MKFLTIKAVEVSCLEVCFRFCH